MRDFNGEPHETTGGILRNLEFKKNLVITQPTCFKSGHP